MTTPTRAEQITATLLEPFPQDVIEDKQGMAFIGHEYIRMRLIEATGNQFSFTIDNVEYRNDGAMKPRTDKNTGEIVETPVCVVTGTLTIPELGSRTDVGVQEIQAGGGADSSYKGAASDCLKRCAMSFGVALQQLYIDTGKPGQAAKRSGSSARQQASVQTRQHPETGELPITDDQFRTQFDAATAANDSDAKRRLVTLAGMSPSRWMYMVGKARDLNALEWVERQTQQRGLDLADAIRIRREELVS